MCSLTLRTSDHWSHYWFQSELQNAGRPTSDDSARDKEKKRKEIKEDDVPNAIRNGNVKEGRLRLKTEGAKTTRYKDK